MNKNYNENLNYIEAWSVAVNALSGKKRENLLEDGFVSSAKGYKVCYITEIKNFTFRGLGFGEYNLSSRSKCEKKIKKCSITVNLNCECGFYAFYDQSKAFNLAENYRGLVPIEVELYGKIIMHKDGMRGEEQDVIRVFLSRICSKGYCNREGIYLSKKVSFYNKKKKYLVRCEKHKSNENFMISEISKDKIDIVRY